MPRPARATSALAGPALLAVSLLVLGCAGLGSFGTGAPAACWPRFAYTGGWLGGDAGYSVRLPDGRDLWLFGDSFVGAPGQADRAGAAFIHNSVGISQCGQDGRFDVHYAWGRAEDGSPRAFFPRGQDGGWWWLFGGFVHAGALYVGLLEVERTEPAGPLGMPFRFSGTALARIANPGDAPQAWQVEVLPLSRGSLALPLSALVVHDDHLYLFAFLDQGGGRYPRALSRLPLERLVAETEDLSDALETLGRDGRWHPGLDPETAGIVMADNATEMSVHYRPSLGRWVALYNYPDVTGSFPRSTPSDAVYVRTAQALEGPWSEPRTVFRIPELAAGSDPNVGCYAAKEHAAFALPGSLTFTYVCNLFSGPDGDALEVLQRLQTRMDLYRPVAATITLPLPERDKEARE